jgi:signal transduction histidine kinase/ligand-binding sensor domain-containing protein
MSLLFLVFSHFEYSAQHPFPLYTNYNIQEGLSSSKVYSCFQDIDGYIWFATDTGVSRFDGSTFHRYSIADGLCDDEVRTIAQDNHGRIWFLTESNCLSFFENGHFSGVADHPNLEVVTDILESNHFFESQDGTIFISGKGNQIVKITSELKASVDVVSMTEGLSLIPKEIEGSVEWLNVGHQVCTDYAEQDDFAMSCISRIGPSSVLALTNDGIVFHETGSEVLIAHNELPDCEDISGVFMGSNQNIWTTSKTDGVDFFKYTDSGYLPPERILSGIRVNYVFSDADDNLWYCSDHRGVFLVRKAQESLSVYQPREDDQALCLTEAPNGYVLAGTSSGLMCIFDGRHLATQFKIVQERGSNGVSQVLIDSVEHSLWCAGDFGLLKFPLMGSTWLPLPTTVSLENIQSLAQTSDGRLIATTINEIKTLDLNSESQELSEMSRVPQSRIHCSFVDSQNRMWFEIGNTLMCFDRGLMTEYSQYDDLFATRITAINETPDGAIVISTYGNGVHYLKEQLVIESLTENEGLLSNQCKQMHIIDNLHFLATDHGVVILNWNKDRARIESTYTHLDGLPSNDIHDISVRDSIIYLATSGGLVMFDRGTRSDVSRPPPLKLSSFSVADSLFNTSERITLEHDHSYVTIDYTGISFDRPDEIIYQYKLTEEDTSWVQTPNNSLQFSNFEPGDYQFTLRARKHNSDWGDEVGMSFTVLPPFYSTWWFRVLFVLAVLLLVAGIVRFLIRRKYEKQLAIVRQEQAVLEERNRISADMHDDLGSELTNIVILSRIAQTKGDNGVDNESIKKIDNAATSVIKKMNQIIWALNPANDTLDGLIMYLRQNVNDFLEFHDLDGRMSIPKEIPETVVQAAFRRNVFLVVKESLQNINKHAEAGVVNVEVKIRGEYLELKIEDNGKGFSETELDRVGNGLRNMRNRVSDIKGEIEISSKPGEGTVTQLTLPLNIMQKH